MSTWSWEPLFLSGTLRESPLVRSLSRRSTSLKIFRMSMKTALLVRIAVIPARFRQRGDQLPRMPINCSALCSLEKLIGRTPVHAPDLVVIEHQPRIAVGVAGAVRPYGRVGRIVPRPRTLVLLFRRGGGFGCGSAWDPVLGNVCSWPSGSARPDGQRCCDERRSGTGNEQGFCEFYHCSSPSGGG